jgi:hypothetical protein
MRRIFTWSGAAVAFAIFMVWRKPDQSATAVKNVGGVLMDIADGFGEFFSRLVS